MIAEKITRHDWSRGLSNRIIATAVLLAAVAARPDAVRTDSLTLRGAVAISLERNRDLQKAAAGVEAAQGRVVEARSGALPTITGNGRYTHSWKLPSVTFMGETFRLGAPNDYAFDITLQQTLFSGGRQFAAIAVAREYRRFAEAGYRIARQGAIERTVRAYYGALLADQLAGVAESTLESAEAHAARVETMYRRGVASEFDHLRARVAAENARPFAIRARSAAELAMTALRNTLALSPNEPLALADSLVAPQVTEEPPEAALLYQEAMSKRDEVAAAELMVSLRKRAVGIYRADKWPVLLLAASYGLAAQTENNPPDGPGRDQWFDSWQASLILSVPLFDGLRADGTVQTAQAELRSAQLDRQQLEDGIRLELEAARADVVEAGKRVESLGETVSLAGRGLRIAEVRFESGVGTGLEVADARVALEEARSNHATAVHDYLVALARLAAARGIDLENYVLAEAGQ